MNNLEQDLGCKLFIRTNRGISLTPEGLRLYGRAAAAFEQLRLGESEIRGDCSLETGSISIAASETALHLILLERLATFHKLYPGVHLRITNGSTPRAVKALLRSQVDCAVAITPFQVKNRCMRPLCALSGKFFSAVRIFSICPPRCGGFRM